MTKKRHYCQRWFCPPNAWYSRGNQKILNHWLKETVFGFKGFWPRVLDFTLTGDA